MYNKFEIAARDILIEKAYDKGYNAGKQIILDGIEDILDRCAHDNGAMIVRELKALIKMNEVGIK